MRQFKKKVGGEVGYTFSRFGDFPIGPGPPVRSVFVFVAKIDQSGEHREKLTNLKGNRKMNNYCDDVENYDENENEERGKSALLDTPLYRQMCRWADADDRRQAEAKKRKAMWNGAIRYNDPLKDENGDDQEDRSLSDRGKGAEIIYQLDRQPEWFDTVVKVIDSLEGVEKAVVDALFQDLRPAVAAKIAGVNRQRVYRVMESLRGKLAEAHRLWKMEH